jgi:hypothetical protein
MLFTRPYHYNYDYYDYDYDYDYYDYDYYDYDYYYYDYDYYDDYDYSVRAISRYLPMVVSDSNTCLAERRANQL